MAQRGGTPSHGAALPQPPAQHHQMGMNGMSLGSGVGSGPGTSGMLLPTSLGERGSLGEPQLGGVGEGVLKAPAAPQQPSNSSNQAVADDASSGYGSPDSLTMEDR